jgi:hypothetical protein
VARYAALWCFTTVRVVKLTVLQLYKYVPTAIETALRHIYVSKPYLNRSVQSTAHQALHFGLSTALIFRPLALITNYKCIAGRVVDRSLCAGVQAGEVSCAASGALRAGCGRLAAAGERAGGGAARAAHRLRRALSLLLHARAHLAHDHARCRYTTRIGPLLSSSTKPKLFIISLLVPTDGIQTFLMDYT